MRQFLQRLLLFFLPPLLYMSTMYIYNYTISKGTPLTFDPSTRSLFVGDSRFGAGINDSIIPNCMNLSMPGEHYLVTYFKLKHIVEANQSIDTVYISFSYSNLAKSMDYKFYNMPQYVDECATRLFPFTWHNLLLSEINELSSLKTIIKRACLYPNNDFYEKSIGGFKSNNTQVDSSVVNYAESAVKKHYYIGSDGKENAQLQLEYLDSICRYAKISSITLGIISMPLHHEYISRVPISYKYSYDSIKKALIEHEQVVFIDYMDSLYYDYEFENHDHLNVKGSVRFSNALVLDLYNRSLSN